VTKADRRRDEILDRLADFVLASGLQAASLRPLAQAAGLSDRMLLYYFEDKRQVLAATLERIAQRLVTVLSSRAAPVPLPAAVLQPHLLDLVLDDTLWPYLRLWLQIAAGAGQGDALLRELGGEIGRGFLSWIAAQIAASDDATRERQAAAMLVTIEGLVMLKSVGLEDVCRPALD
jgi:AcrR family transcriptional regulator